jgi:apolipoprotein D and lipocalin family protein
MAHHLYSVLFCYVLPCMSLFLPVLQQAMGEPEVVKGVDLKRYMGRWYEIASFPSFFQPKNGENTRATYTLNSNGTVDVLNETWNNGKRESIHGIAYKADPNSDEAKLKVRFLVPPFLPFIPVLGDYWILYLDQDYQYALIGGPTKLFLWVSNSIYL